MKTLSLMIATRKKIEIRYLFQVSCFFLLKNKNKNTLFFFIFRHPIKNQVLRLQAKMAVVLLYR